MRVGALPVAAAADAAAGLLDLFVVLVAAKIGDEVLKRLGQPGLVGEILAGVPEVAGLGGATGRVVGGIEVQDHTPAA